jgi:hypothetical protein
MVKFHRIVEVNANRVDDFGLDSMIYLSIFVVVGPELDIDVSVRNVL